MPPRVLQTYYDWKYSPPEHDYEALHRFVGAAMDHIAVLAPIVTYDRVVIAVAKGGDMPALAPLVAGAWRLYLMRAPSGPAAVTEATDWIMQLLPAVQRHRVFADVLDNLIAQVTTKSARR